MKKSSFKNLKTKGLSIGDLNRSKGGDHDRDLTKAIKKWIDDLEKKIDNIKKTFS